MSVEIWSAVELERNQGVRTSEEENEEVSDYEESFISTWSMTIYFDCHSHRRRLGPGFGGTEFGGTGRKMCVQASVF